MTQPRTIVCTAHDESLLLRSRPITLPCLSLFSKLTKLPLIRNNEWRKLKMPQFLPLHPSQVPNLVFSEHQIPPFHCVNFKYLDICLCSYFSEFACLAYSSWAPCDNVLCQFRERGFFFSR